MKRSVRIQRASAVWIAWYRLAVKRGLDFDTAEQLERWARDRMRQEMRAAVWSNTSRVDTFAWPAVNFRPGSTVTIYGMTGGSC